MIYFYKNLKYIIFNKLYGAVVVVAVKFRAANHTITMR